ncbi:hypothetical protein OGAPHI_005183 [Ogataea philodendri]|uniref:Uncharacterized protein n=1 Tax=Ogataea philodendri TaxID=1378263 RepID=A0A9P8P1W8_9ASCO|nr:uncharacterized protein OGAPHI_005183 [Ogataea philodendri]KAH3663780.1 hypothetical protein OGAPHI_005183 [Ogataea philodendri]
MAVIHQRVGILLVHLSKRNCLFRGVVNGTWLSRLESQHFLDGFFQSLEMSISWSNGFVAVLQEIGFQGVQLGKPDGSNFVKSVTGNVTSDGIATGVLNRRFKQSVTQFDKVLVESWSSFAVSKNRACNVFPGLDVGILNNIVNLFVGNTV